MNICTNCNWKWYNTVYKWEWWYTDFWEMRYIETLPMWIHKVPCSKCQVEEEVKEFEKETTWQTVYEQLQEMLNKCIELWWKPNWIHIVSCIIHIVKSNIEVLLYDSKPLPIKLSVHDLFSVDNGIMEFVEWVDSDTYHNYICMCEKTAEEKVQYFVNNALIRPK